MKLAQKLSAVFSLALVGCTLAGNVQAANLITNGSFETGNFVNNGNGAMSLAVGATDVTGWKVTNAEIAWTTNLNSYGLTASDGSYFLDLTGYHDAVPYGGVTQTINTTPGQAYTLAFNLDVNQSDGRYSGPVGIQAAAGSTSQAFTFNPSGSGNQFGLFGFNFVAAASTTAITFTGTQGNQYIGLDNVSVISAAVPESSAMTSLSLLLGLGGASIFAGTRRKTRKTSS